jgi:YesN/AraC family two-component response regulator
MAAKEKHKTPKTFRVLIADDAQVTRRNTRLMLAEHEDVDVVAIASNGEDAVLLAETHRPDIAVLDINMPRMDGLTAFQKMSEMHPDMGCIIISAEKDEDSFREAMNVGAREYLVKPFTFDELMEAINRVGKIVLEKRKGAAQREQIRSERELYLKQLAHEYAKTRRVDDQSVAVFERLAANPDCELNWLMNLALIYLVRRNWGKLKDLAARLENQVISSK